VSVRARETPGSVRAAPSRLGTLITSRTSARHRDPLRRRLLAAADISSALLVCVAVGAYTGVNAALLSLLFVPVWIVLAKVQGLYDHDHRHLRHLTVDEFPRILSWTLTGSVALTLVLASAKVESRSRVFLIVFVVATASALIFRPFARFLYRRITPPERTVIVGSGWLASAAKRKLELFPDIHARVIGFEPVDFLRGNGKASSEWLRDVDRVILASTTIGEELLSNFLRACRESHTKLSVVPPVRGMFGTAIQLSYISDLTVIEYNTWDVSRSTLVLKRALDVTVALAAVIVLLPLAALVALAIRFTSPGPIIFSQRRAGRAGRPFLILKFRTMVDGAEARLSEVVSLERLREPVFKLERDPRLTRVGRTLRRTSLDELPQLINILKGEMSLVGPRPEQVELVERYRPEDRFRLDVKPGLTGPMQVFGRAQLTFEERLAVEREYIENLSLGRDLRILALTVSAVVSGRGAF
jgi:exopolysaccharide biosynthesis polyprenyl glycosylphosphotransferase